jgi:hypothetical protein
MIAAEDTAVTEAEWLNGDDPRPMLAYLVKRLSPRKLRLFSIACARLRWRSLSDERTRSLLALAERYAVAAALPAELAAARSIGYCHGLIWTIANATHAAEWWVNAVDGGKRERAGQAGLCREIFGNPFRQSSVETSWLAWQGGTLPKLARGIYDGRAFDRLPILADALEDAGCTDGELLAHCREPGGHVLGCWALDAVVGAA